MVKYKDKKRSFLTARDVASMALNFPTLEGALAFGDCNVHLIEEVLRGFLERRQDVLETTFDEVLLKFREDFCVLSDLEAVELEIVLFNNKEE